MFRIPLALFAQLFVLRHLDGETSHQTLSSWMWGPIQPSKRLAKVLLMQMWIAHRLLEESFRGRAPGGLWGNCTKTQSRRFCGIMAKTP
jgi:hypothetical protein